MNLAKQTSAIKVDAGDLEGDQKRMNGVDAAPSDGRRVDGRLEHELALPATLLRLNRSENREADRSRYVDIPHVVQRSPRKDVHRLAHPLIGDLLHAVNQLRNALILNAHSLFIGTLIRNHAPIVTGIKLFGADVSPSFLLLIAHMLPALSDLPKLRTLIIAAYEREAVRKDEGPGDPTET